MSPRPGRPSRSDRPSGCMAVQSALTCSDAAAAVRSDLAARRVAGVDAFRERFDRARNSTAICLPPWGPC